MFIGSLATLRLAVPGLAVDLLSSVPLPSHRCEGRRRWLPTSCKAAYSLAQSYIAVSKSSFLDVAIVFGYSVALHGACTHSFVFATDHFAFAPPPLANTLLEAAPEAALASSAAPILLQHQGNGRYI